MMSYAHIKPDERVELAVLLRAGHKQSEIAKILDKHPSSISREIRRNSTNEGRYNCFLAKRNTRAKRLNANKRFRKLRANKKLKRYIERKLRKYWSPEQIAGRLKFRYGKTILCHETIYQFIYKKREDLKRFMRCQKGKYRKRYGTKKREKAREEAKKKRIDTRPDIVERRGRLGDFEGDTIVGEGKKERILTHVDRMSGYLLADRLERGLSEITRKTTVKRFKSLPKKKKFTITYDNGMEFSEYELIERETEMDVYHAYPYHSWERGTNENTNGLLRQFFPKKSSFTEVTQEKLEKVVNLINHRPRKRLGYLTPHEVFIKNCTLD